MNNERLVLNCKEVAALLGLAPNSVFKGILAGEIPHVKVGKRILIPRHRFERWLEENVKVGDPPG